MRLHNKVAVVTGATGGIGRAITERFQTEGARVYALDRIADETTVTSSCFLQCDVRVEATVKRCIQKLTSETGQIDILVNAAGINPRPAPVTETTTADFDDVYATNLKGTFLLSRLVLPHMTKGAAIINIASILALRGVPACAAYTASKGGILAMTRAMAKDCAPEVRVNVISPGAVQTTMFDEYLERVADPETERERIRRTIPLQRIGTPEDIASAALFLASDEATWITGQNLIIDGGDSI